MGTNRSTCRGECSLLGPLVTPRGRCHHGPLTNGPWRIPLYCVCSGGADTVTGGRGKPPRPGPLPASPLGTLCPDPPPALPVAVPPPPAPLFPRPAPHRLRWGPSASLLGPLSVRGLALSCSLCPPSHRHNARQFRGRAVVGVARARVSRSTRKVHFLPARAGVVFATVFPPHPALSPLSRLFATLVPEVSVPVASVAAVVVFVAAACAL